MNAPRLQHPHSPAGVRVHMRMLLSALLGTLVLFPPAARAQTLEYLVNDEADGEESQVDPALTRLDDGRILALWVDNAWGQTDIRSRILGTDLDTLTTPVLVSTDPGAFPRSGVLVSQAGGGRIVAAWIDGREGDPEHADPELYAQVLSSADGSRVGGNVHLKDASAAGDQTGADAAVDAQGTALVCWADNRNGVSRIWGQRISSSGALVGSNIALVPEDPSQQQYNPGLAPLPGGGFLLAWDQVIDGFHQVRYRFLGADAAPLGEPRAPADATGFDQEDPAVLVRAQDILIAWTDNRQGTSDPWGEWLTPEGDPDGVNVRLRNQQNSARDDACRLVAASDGSFALTWFGGAGGSQRAMVRFFGSDRSPRSDEMPMSDPGAQVVMRSGSAAPLPGGAWALAWSDGRSLADQAYVDRADPVQGPSGTPHSLWAVPASAAQVCGDVAFFPGGRAIVVWGDARNADYAIRARFLDSSGRPEGQSFRVNFVPTNLRFTPPAGINEIYPYSPHVAASPLGTFVVTWTVDAGGGRRALYAKLFDPQGSAIGDDFLVSHVGSIPPVQPQFDPRPAMGSDGRFAIAWRDDAKEQDGDVYVQRYSAVGDTVGAPILAPNSGFRNSAQQSPALAISPYNDMVVAWIDRRNGGWDIFRQRLDPAGRRLDPDDVQLNTPDGPFDDQLYPSIATNGTAIVTVWDERPLTTGLIRGRLEVLESKAAWAGTAAPSKTAGQGIGSPASIVDFIVNPADHPRGLHRPAVSMDATGRFVVVWSDVDRGQTRVWAQRFDAAGAVMGHPYPLDEGDAPGLRALPRVSTNPNRIEYVWTDSRRARGWDIYVHNVSWQYSGDPNPVELNLFSADATARGLLLQWSIPVDVRAPACRLWRDDSGEAAGAPGSAPPPTARLLTADPIAPVDGGRFRYEDESVPAATTVLYYLETRDLGATRYFGPLVARWDPRVAAGWLAGPNPFREDVRFVAPDANPVRLELMDASGRRIRVLERSGTSTEPLTWDGRDTAGVPVPCGIYLVRPVPLRGPDHPFSSADPARRTFKLIRVR